jgi:uncharacterized protein with HEPN domain
VKDDSIYLGHILDAISRIEDYVSPGRTIFFDEPMRQDAVVRQLEVIGEAVKQVSGVARERQPAIPWRQIGGMRDVLIHEYFAVDLEQVWMVTQRDLPVLRRAIEALLSAPGDRS